MAYPKFVYDAGAGDVDLLPTYPPIEKSGTFDLNATREDTQSISGILQSIYSRTEELLPLNFAFVPAADISDWSDFFAFALTGAEFRYYPDADVDEYDDYTLVDAKWNPRMAFKTPDGMMTRFSITLRKRVSFS